MFNDTHFPPSAADGPDIDLDPGLEAGFDADDPPGATTPPRFGRLALCVAAASALALGVIGTVAYGIWFNHDQQAYAEAMTSARQALGVMAVKSNVVPRPVAPATASTVGPATLSQAVTSQPFHVAQSAIQPTPLATLTSAGEEGGKEAVWAGQVTRTPAAATPGTTPSARIAGASSETPVAITATTPSSSRTTRRATGSTDPVPQQLASSRSGKDARSAQQERRANTANARHKGSLFARMGLFFRRVSYRQHGSESQQHDPYSHP